MSSGMDQQASGQGPARPAMSSGANANYSLA